MRAHSEAWGAQPGAVKAHNGAVKTHPGGPGGTALQGKSHLRIPFLGIARPQSQFLHSPHSCVCERFMYIPRIDPDISLQQNRQTDPWKYINLSQIYECMN